MYFNCSQVNHSAMVWPQRSDGTHSTVAFKPSSPTCLHFYEEKGKVTHTVKFQHPSFSPLSHFLHIWPFFLDCFPLFPYISFFWCFYFSLTFSSAFHLSFNWWLWLIKGIYRESVFCFVLVCTYIFLHTNGKNGLREKELCFCCAHQVFPSENWLAWCA